jgi:parallel beta-helix repeat protein
MEHREWYRRRGVIATVCGLVLAAGIAVAAAVLDDPENSATGDRPGPKAPVATSPAPARPPATPPVRVCGNASVLDGSTTPPAGAVTVATTQNLDHLTEAHPAGTTFWLAPGVHQLGANEFSQVIPKNGNVYLGAPGAILDGQRRNRYAFTGNAVNVTIRNITVQNFGPRGTNSDEGVVNHDSAAGWLVERNTIWRNAGAGMMIGNRNTVRGNCLAENGQYGFNAYHRDNVANIVVEGNEISGNNTDDWENVRAGCGCTGGGKFWMVTGAVVKNNWVHDNLSVGLWADTNNVGFAFEGNYISDNGAEGIIYETSYNAVIRHNTFARNGRTKGPDNDGFPTGAVYVSESGSDNRVPGAHRETFEISHNVFTDNWAGVILWENADRFAGSPTNTSTDASTLVNPRLVNRHTCNASTIRKHPYVDDCRWKTKNVRVHDNVFTLDPERLGKGCSSRTGCGANAVFSNWGTFPAWSPYKEQVVQDRITFEQGNRFYANTYEGPWHFVVHEQGRIVNWSTWQGAPYGQDADSVIKLSTPRTR